MGSFLFGEGETIFEGNRTSAREEVVSYAALALKSKQKRLRMRRTKKFNVYVFVTTTISTWMNGNLHEPT